MIIKLFFLLFLLFLIKIFIIHFDFRDFFNLSITILFLLIGLLFITNNSKIYPIYLIIFTLVLIIYSYFKRGSSNNSIIIIDGNIDFLNMYKNKYSLSSLLWDLKDKKITKLNNDLCAILRDGKLSFYYKENNYKKFILVIINGKIEPSFIKDEPIIINTLKKYNCEIDKVSLAYYYNKTFYIRKK